MNKSILALIVVLIFITLGCGAQRASVGTAATNEEIPVTGDTESQETITDEMPAGESKDMVETAPVADADTMNAPDETTSAVDETADAGVGMESDELAQIASIYQEAKRYLSLGQEAVGQQKQEQAMEYLEQAIDQFEQIVDVESPMRNQILMDYINIKDYLGRQYREEKKDFARALDCYLKIVDAIGDNLNTQKQFYLAMAADTLFFDMNDHHGSKPYYEAILEYCGTIEPGNLSACTDWELIQTSYMLDRIGKETDGDGWKGYTPQTMYLPSRDFENYYLLAAGLLDSSPDMDTEVWTQETGYTDEFFESQSNERTRLDILLINCFHGETQAPTDPVLGDALVEKNIERLLELFPDHPATLIMLVKYSIHIQKMLRIEEAESYRRRWEDLARELNITMVVDEDAPPVQDFLRREYPQAPDSENPGTEGEIGETLEGGAGS